VRHVNVSRYGRSDATLPWKTHAAVAVAARHDEVRHPQIQAKNEGHSYRPTLRGTGGSQSWKAQAWKTCAGEAISHPSPGGGKGISSLRQNALIPERLMETRATNPLPPANSPAPFVFGGCRRLAAPRFRRSLAPRRLWQREEGIGYKVWGIAGGSLALSTVVLYPEKRLTASSGAHGEFKEISVGTHSETESFSRVSVYKDGVLSLTRDARYWPMKAEPGGAANGAPPHR